MALSEHFLNDDIDPIEARTPMLMLWLGPQL